MLLPAMKKNVRCEDAKGSQDTTLQQSYLWWLLECSWGFDSVVRVRLRFRVTDDSLPNS